MSELDVFDQIRTMLPPVDEVPAFKRDLYGFATTLCFSCDRPISRSHFTTIAAADSRAVRAKEHLCTDCKHSYEHGNLTFTAKELHGHE